MPIHSSRVRSLAIAGVAIGAAGLGLLAAGPANFKPDGTFTGSTLAGWHVVGDATWKAQNGELVGTAKPGTSGGWLVMDKSFQDVQLYANYRCTGDCKSGVLLRAQKTPDGGMTGVFVSLTEGDTGVYAITLDSSGKETARDQITAPSRGGGGARRGAAAGGAGGRAAAEPAPVPAAGGRQAAPAPRGTQQGSAGRRGPTLQANEWNEEYITIGQEGPTANSTERRNEVVSTFAGTIPLDEQHAGGYGPVALYVGGAGEVHYKDLAWKDLMHVVEPKEVVSSHYTIQRINPLYYGWGATTADVNHDGTLDVISGPFYYLGPSFTERSVYREGVIYNPENSFAPDMVNLAADFTGDGWPDVLSSLGNRHMDLYVESERGIAALGEIQRAADDLVGDRALEGSRQGRQARSHLRSGRGRWLRVGASGSGESNRRLDAARDLQPGPGRERPRPRRRRRQRRRPAGRRRAHRLVRAAGRRHRDEPVDVPRGRAGQSERVRQRRRRDGRVRRQRRRPPRHRRGLGPQLGLRLVRAEEGWDVRAAPDHEGLLDGEHEHRRRGLLGAARRTVRRHGRRWSSGRHHGQALLVGGGEQHAHPQRSVRDAGALHLQDRSRSQGAGRSALRARADPQQVGRRLVLRRRRPEQGRQAGHRHVHDLRHVRVREQSGCGTWPPPRNDRTSEPTGEKR